MVALKAHEVERFLKKPAEDIRLFLLYGSDSGAITERARTLEQLALKRGGGEAVLRVGSDELSAEPGRLADEANSASLFGTSVTVIDSYTRSSQNFANVRARRDAEDRLAQNLANLTQARLAAYFATH